jgi:S1-C subfamily serine protease
MGINTMVAGRLALAVPSNAVADFLSGADSNRNASDAWLGVTLYPVQVPKSGSRVEKAFGLVVLEIEPASPAARASLLPGDILLGTDGKPFSLLEDLSRALGGIGPRVLRLEFLRGDYARTRRVTIQLGGQRARSGVAA